jgi:quercetin dioxygenase-like cupin family protein
MSFMKETSTSNLSANILDISAAIRDLESDLEKTVNALPLYKSLELNIMLIALKAQAELKRHTAPGTISVQVIKGSISFRTDDNSNDLTIGQLLTLEGNVPHSVYAYESSVILVTKSIPA